MNRHRKIIFSAGSLGAIVLATPVAAHASPLLSGYGGPGQGSQIILGSSLLGGPGGGGGRAAAAGEASTDATQGGLALPAGSTSSSSPAGATSSSSVSGVHAAQGAVPGRHSTSSGAPAGGSRGAPAGSSRGALGTYPAAARQTAPPALGVSQDDLLYILLALGLLVLAGVLTRRFAYLGSGPARGAE